MVGFTIIFTINYTLLNNFSWQLPACNVNNIDILTANTATLVLHGIETTLDDISKNMHWPQVIDSYGLRTGSEYLASSLFSYDTVAEPDHGFEAKPQPKLPPSQFSHERVRREVR